MAIFTWLLVLAVLAGSLYQVAASLLTRNFMRKDRILPRKYPAMSLLKPLAGDEPGLKDGLQSLCRQAYPEFQIICGVDDPQNTVVAVIDQVQTNFPQISIDVVINSASQGSNRKISNVINILSAARHSVLVLADSDIIAIDENYLADIAAAFDEPSVGLVTCLYRAVPTEGLWSRLGALGINHGFLPSALVARSLGRKDGCFGATMAISASLLRQIGGFEKLQNVLADDWVLGELVRREGKKIALSARPVELVMDEPDFMALFNHELRWGRTIASIDRISYVASIITQPVALAFIAILLGGLSLWPLMVLTVLARLVAVRIEEKALQIKTASLCDLLLREMVSFVVFLCAICGRTVSWRGKKFHVRRDGTMELLEGT